MIKSYPSNFIYLALVVASVGLVASSNNWFISWLGLELSLFGFLPLFTSSPQSSEGLMKYFLVQAAGSAVFLASVLAPFYGGELLTLAMGLKLGLFPFVQWVPLVMISLGWFGCLVLSTLQKINPLLLFALAPAPGLKVAIALATMVAGSALGFNQTLMRPLMAYSSISHSGWLVITTALSLKLALCYAALYFLLTASLFFSFDFSSASKVNSANPSSHNQNLLLLNLVGVPPLSMFVIKLNVLVAMVSQPLLILPMILSLSVNSYFYLNILMPQLLRRSSSPWALLAALSVAPFILAL